MPPLRSRRCQFAEELRATYVAQSTRGVPITIVAYSPVTGEGYDMQCIPSTGIADDGSRVRGVECSGGNDALVWLWGNN